ncbi:hypothetical protein CGQ12_23270 [Pseudomonas aeruginosa]|uniref:hypothetical protein n=2 Tax=Gammaproteobacteria TaxID=1236 RepID=UPI000BA0E43E|nr:hypothetical protein [Pseudomonas aeruginosa]OZN69122.1 hypothetical protein CGQ12_23270 [Pseudomonas aeruginosa]OZN74533.1 hypothetical protein CGQ14_30845 [Pseudomonas aeruginosa]
MSSTQHQLIEQCATRLRGIVEALDNIHDNTPHRWSTDLDDVHSSAESLLAMIKDQAPPSQDQLIAAGLSYPLAKEDAVKLWYAGFRSEVVTVLEAWEAIGHDTGINPDKEELLESLRNMAAICNAHGNDMPAQSAIDQRQVIADAITGALAFGAQASQPPAEDHWLRPFYDIGRAEGQRTQELAMLVRMLASSLKRHAPESNLVARATNYLAAKGLAGTPLRDPPAPVEQAGRDVEPAPCPFCGGEVDPTGWLRGDGTRGPECNYCGATARSMEAWQTRAALAQPEGAPVIGCLCGMPMTEGHHSPDGCCNLEEFAPQEQAEQAEAERPEVVAWQYRVTAGPQTGWSLWHPGKGEEFERSYTVERRPLMTVAQHERIVGELRAVIAQLRQHKNDYMDSGQETYRALQNEIREREAEIARLDGLVSGRTAERDAALARVADMKTMADNYCALLMDANAKLAEMERQEPVALANRGLHAFWVKWTEAAAGLYGPGIKLYTAPVAQAQHSVPEVSGIGRDFAYPRSVVLYLRTEPTDDDLRAIHDGLRSLAAAPGKEVPQAWLDVQAERRRQVEAEGWTPEHDDEHADGQMAQAAGCYALHAGGIGTDWPDGRQNGSALFWPWDKDSWKPTTPRRDLVKACALALAEIERLDRAGISQSPQPGATTASS